MNKKQIARHLNNVIYEWMTSIDSQDVREAIEKDAYVAGGSIVSLLLGEKPNDYKKAV